MKTNWVILIPAYKPDKLLLHILEEARKQNFQMVIVDDGSGTETEAVFRQAAEYGTVLRHPDNQGKGRAIKTGLKYIGEHYSLDCIVVTADADGQHKISDAQKLCEVSRQYPESLILGSRKLKGRVPIRSRFGNTVTRFVYQICTGQKIWDTQTGLRAFGSRLIPQLLTIEGERYEYEMNVLLSFSRVGIPIREVEIDTIYIDDNESSHFDTLKDSYRIYKEILRFSAVSLISFFLDYGLYSLLTAMTEEFGTVLSLLIPNVGARIVSASVNYTLNRKLVFKGNPQMIRSVIQYALLAGGILVGNTFVLGLLVDSFGMNRYGAKLMTEISFFLASWLIQRNCIFRNHRDRAEKEAEE